MTGTGTAHTTPNYIIREMTRMYRILLVEDDAALADAITQVLTAWGHEVQKVSAISAM